MAFHKNNPIRLLQITDSHLSADAGQTLNGIDTDRSLRSVIDHINDTHADADYVLATGDLSHDGSAVTYARLYEYFLNLQLPVACLAGNHDDVKMLRTYLQADQISCSRQFILNRWQIILLNSVVREHSGGHLIESELEFLDRRLQAGQDKFALVCLHHQPTPIGSPWMDRMGLDNGEQLFTILEAHPQARGVLWGHVHQEYDRSERGLRLLASPSTCVQFKPLSEDFALDDKPPGYRWLELYDDGNLETGIEWVHG
ncbi:MAG: 3',5'-cyclic-AMP phosphodiesterase [Gammaproteobacteria bacterium]